MGLAIGLVGCGSDPAEEAYVPRLCETDGPVRLLEVEPPPGATWSIQPVGDRLVARWYVEDSDEGDDARFEAYVVDACGESTTALPPDLMPYVVDDVLWGCNVETGLLSRLDAGSGEVQEVAPGTYDCTNRGTFSNVVMLADGAQERLTLLTAEGPTVLEVELDPPEADFEPDFPAFAGRYGSYGSGPADELVVVERGRHFRVNVASSEFVEFDPPLGEAYIGDGRFVTWDTDLAQAGLHETVIRDGLFREIGPGPTIEGPILWNDGPYLASADRLYALRDGTTHPAPRHLYDAGRSSALWEWLAYTDGNDYEVWDPRTDETIYTYNSPPGSTEVVYLGDAGGVLQIERIGTHHIIEVLDPQRGVVEEVARVPADYAFARFWTRPGAYLGPSFRDAQRGPILYVDTTTFETVELTPAADGVATFGFALSIGDDFYFARHSGEGAGLWRTRLPSAARLQQPAHGVEGYGARTDPTTN